MRALSRILPFHLIAATFIILAAMPVSAHDMPVGGSRWCFGKDRLVANVDLGSSLLSDIKGIKEGGNKLDSSSDRQLQQLASDILQPYFDTKLAVTVNGKTRRMKVTGLARKDARYIIWLTLDNIAFKYPDNRVRIDYRLLFEETGNSHINLAYTYFSDATGDALQKIFDFSAPAGQYTFEHNSPAWEVSVKGPAFGTATVQKAAIPAAAGGSDAVLDGTGAAPKRKEIAAAPVAAGKTAPGTPVLTSAAIAISEKAPRREAAEGSISLSAKAPLTGTETGTSSSVPAAPSGKSLWAGIGDFVLLGIKHILTGYDHIAFLLALIVIGLSFKEVLKIITAFTLAHSITLLLAALQIVSLNSRFVESVIALSICYVALENIFRKKVNYRWLVTFVFGLIHGFGFASALQEMIVGKSNLIVSVLSFNVGVEIGQLMIFFVMLPVLYLLKNKAQFRIVTTGTSVAIFAIGFAWFIERVFDLKMMPF